MRTIEFLQLCCKALKPGGQVIAYAMNGANPLVGSENISHNIDHFYNLTDRPVSADIAVGRIRTIRTFPLKLYVFWKNPLNYVGLLATGAMELAMRIAFALREEGARAEQEDRSRGVQAGLRRTSRGSALPGQVTPGMRLNSRRSLLIRVR
jgi:hypothetical protein